MATKKSTTPITTKKPVPTKKSGGKKACGC